MNISKESEVQEFEKCPRVRKKLKRNNVFELKRKIAIRTNRIVNFNKWFKKEHSYCLPFENNEKIDSYRLLKQNLNNAKNSCENYDALESNPKNENFDGINVNNELNSNSLYAIDVTTELLKDALSKNKKKQRDCENLVNEPSLERLQIPNKDISSFDGKMLKNQKITQYQEQRNDETSLELLKSPLSMDIDDLSKLDSILNFPNNQYLEEKLNCDNDYLGQCHNNSPSNFCRSSEDFSESNSKIHHSLSIRSSSKKDSNNSDYFNSNQHQVAKKFSSLSKPNVTNIQSLSQQYLNIFNRYQEQRREYFIEKTEHPTPILLRDLLCGSKPKTIISPYTHRHLKPYILKDGETKPQWLKMLKEIKEHYRLKNKLPPCMESETIDYSYVRAKHIKSVNALAREFFWPGIDLTDSLLYPDFSIIALYKNLIVGFGFMVPDISTNENYITFLFTRPYWTNCGIATFMVYHLTQTCMTRDITLHVSPSNPAMFLYQKFGFKIEEFVQNFYDKYIPGDSSMSKHALFLRLRSTLRSK